MTVIDNTAPTLTAPAPSSVDANASGQGVIPNVVAGTIASDNCGPVTVTQSPLAGTVVGIGTHTITITATDAAGNTSTATTTFTVNGVSLQFSVSMTPAITGQGKLTKLDINYTNVSSDRLSVSFVVRYTSPCESATLETVGPFLINAGAERLANVQFHVPKNACTGSYTFFVDGYVGGVLVGTRTAELTVTSLLLAQKRK